MTARRFYHGIESFSTNRAFQFCILVNTLWLRFPLHYFRCISCIQASSSLCVYILAKRRKRDMREEGDERLVTALMLFLLLYLTFFFSLSCSSPSFSSLLLFRFSSSPPYPDWIEGQIDAWQRCRSQQPIRARKRT